MSHRKKFRGHLSTLIVKNNLPIWFVKCIWLKHLVFCLCPKLNSPSKRQFSQDILLGLVEKINQLYVVLTLVECYFAIVSFDFWMSKGAYDVLHW
jgi:hypothetical protein